MLCGYLIVIVAVAFTGFVRFEFKIHRFAALSEYDGNDVVVILEAGDRQFAIMNRRIACAQINDRGDRTAGDIDQLNVGGGQGCGIGGDYRSAVFDDDIGCCRVRA